MENFAVILHDKGHEIEFQIKKDEEGHPATEITIKSQNTGDWIPIKEFLEDHTNGFDVHNPISCTPFCD